MEIGRRYFQNITMLRKRIREKSVEIKKISDEKKYMCYFCLSEIKKREGFLIINKLENSYEKYPIDDSCLKKAKNFEKISELEIGLN